MARADVSKTFLSENLKWGERVGRKDFEFFGRDRGRGVSTLYGVGRYLFFFFNFLT